MVIFLGKPADSSLIKTLICHRVMVLSNLENRKTQTNLTFQTATGNSNFSFL